MRSTQLSSCIIAVDTSYGTCSIAIIDTNGEVIYEEHEESRNQQAELLIGMIEEGMNKISIWYDNIAALVCTVGPGSFTGIRIGLACLHGISIGKNIPLFGVTTLQAIAYQIVRLDDDIDTNYDYNAETLDNYLYSMTFGIALNASRDQVYYQEYLYIKTRLLDKEAKFSHSYNYSLLQSGNIQRLQGLLQSKTVSESLLHNPTNISLRNNSEIKGRVGALYLDSYHNVYESQWLGIYGNQHTQYIRSIAIGAGLCFYYYSQSCSVSLTASLPVYKNSSSTKSYEIGKLLTINSPSILVQPFPIYVREYDCRKSTDTK